MRFRDSALQSPSHQRGGGEEGFSCVMEDAMTYEEAMQTIPCGRYRHFKGKPYEVIGIARHSETEERSL